MDRLDIVTHEMKLLLNEVERLKKTIAEQMAINSAHAEILALLVSTKRDEEDRDWMATILEQSGMDDDAIEPPFFKPPCFLPENEDRFHEPYRATRSYIINAYIKKLRSGA